MAGDPVLGFQFAELGLFDSAFFLGVWAARVEAAPDRRVERAGDIASQDDALAF